MMNGHWGAIPADRKQRESTEGIPLEIRQRERECGVLYIIAAGALRIRLETPLAQIYSHFFFFSIFTKNYVILFFFAKL